MDGTGGIDMRQWHGKGSLTYPTAGVEEISIIRKIGDGR